MYPKNARTPGRRYWTDHWHIRLAGFIAILMLAISSWFTYVRVEHLTTTPHSPHFEPDHCFDCHDPMGSAMKARDCFQCHDIRTRALLPNAYEARTKLTELPCSHPIKQTKLDSFPTRTRTALCLSCHSTAKPYVAWLNFTTGEYVEIDINQTHPIGLMPTETIYPRTLPLNKRSGAIDCITCHDPHSQDPRLRLTRLYHPGNGHPADYRALCIDCHGDGWLPLTKNGAVRDAHELRK